jgi:hypothetical protein
MGRCVLEVCVRQIVDFRVMEFLSKVGLEFTLGGGNLANLGRRGQTLHEMEIRVTEQGA